MDGVRVGELGEFGVVDVNADPVVRGAARKIGNHAPCRTPRPATVGTEPAHPTAALTVNRHEPPVVQSVDTSVDTLVENGGLCPGNREPVHVGENRRQEAEYNTY